MPAETMSEEKERLLMQIVGNDFDSLSASEVHRRLTEAQQTAASANYGFEITIADVIRKAKKVEDSAAAQAVVEKVVATAVALPAQIAVAMTLSDNPDVREEDYAATMMAVQNILLTARALGLATHLKSGAVMEDPDARNALGLPNGERLVVMIDVGEPAENPAPKPRRAASEVTTWLP